MLTKTKIDSICKEALRSGFSFENLDKISEGNNSTFVVVAVWESSNMLLCGGFELLIESEIQLDRLSDCYMRIGMPELKPLIIKLKMMLSSYPGDPSYDQLEKYLEKSNGYKKMREINQKYYELISGDKLVALIATFLNVEA